MPPVQEATTSSDLDALESICDYLEQQSSRCASSQSLQRVRGFYLIDPQYQNLREGVIYHSAGWGWRLRRDWREALATKRAALSAGSDIAG